MYKIHVLEYNETLLYAAQELKRFLRMMMPECGEIEIKYDPDARDGFRLGLMSTFSLDTSVYTDDPSAIDVLYVNTDAQGGIIAGSNPRSVLMSVYEFLKKQGCRWLFPGNDGQHIPTVESLSPVNYQFKPSAKLRGWCNEGAEFQTSMLEAIEFAPRVGLNFFMQEFSNPKVYYDRYYNHQWNDRAREPEPVTAETTLQFKRECEAEIVKRGLLYGDMGHGWTVESFGIRGEDQWTTNEDTPLPEAAQKYLALVDGKRGLFKGNAFNTNFCMSNTTARKMVRDRVVEYALLNSYVDYLAVDLSDGTNNQCECEECQKKSAWDWYAILLNEIDEELTKHGSKMKLRVNCYLDLMFPPEVETLNNPSRFTINFGPATRSYYETVSPERCRDYVLGKYVRNKVELPTDPSELLEYLHAFNERFGVDMAIYEYHFWMYQFYDPTGLEFAKVIYGDMHGYMQRGIDKICEDGSQRSFWPTGLCFYVYAQTLFDADRSLEDMIEDYFSHAFGEDWKTVYEYLEKMEELIPYKYVYGNDSADPEIHAHYNPAMADKLRRVPALVEEYKEFFDNHKVLPKRPQSISYMMMRRFGEYCIRLAKALSLKCVGLGPEAYDEYMDFLYDFGKYELEMERWFDHNICMRFIRGRIFLKPEGKKIKDDLF